MDDDGAGSTSDSADHPRQEHLVLPSYPELVTRLAQPDESQGQRDTESQSSAAALQPFRLEPVFSPVSIRTRRETRRVIREQLEPVGSAILHRQHALAGGTLSQSRGGRTHHNPDTSEHLGRRMSIGRANSSQQRLPHADRYPAIGDPGSSRSSRFVNPQDDLEQPRHRPFTQEHVPELGEPGPSIMPLHPHYPPLQDMQQDSIMNFREAETQGAGQSGPSQIRFINTTGEDLSTSPSGDRSNTVFTRPIVPVTVPARNDGQEGDSDQGLQLCWERSPPRTWRACSNCRSRKVKCSPEPETFQCRRCTEKGIVCSEAIPFSPMQYGVSPTTVPTSPPAKKSSARKREKRKSISQTASTSANLPSAHSSSSVISYPQLSTQPMPFHPQRRIENICLDRPESPNTPAGEDIPRRSQPTREPQPPNYHVIQPSDSSQIPNIPQAEGSRPRSNHLRHQQPNKYPSFHPYHRPPESASGWHPWVGSIPPNNNMPHHYGRMFVPPQNARPSQARGPVLRNLSHARRHSDNVAIDQRSEALRISSIEQNRRSSLGSSSPFDHARQAFEDGSAEIYSPGNPITHEPRDDYFHPRNGGISRITRVRQISGRLPENATLLLPHPLGINDNQFGLNAPRPNADDYSIHIGASTNWMDPGDQSEVTQPTMSTSLIGWDPFRRSPMRELITQVRLPSPPTLDDREEAGERVPVLIHRAANREGSMEAQASSLPGTPPPADSGAPGNGESNDETECTIYPHIDSDGRNGRGSASADK